MTRWLRKLLGEISAVTEEQINTIPFIREPTADDHIIGELHLETRKLFYALNVKTARLQLLSKAYNKPILFSPKLAYEYENLSRAVPLLINIINASIRDQFPEEGYDITFCVYRGWKVVREVSKQTFVLADFPPEAQKDQENPGKSEPKNVHLRPRPQRHLDS